MFAAGLSSATALLSTLAFLTAVFPSPAQANFDIYRTQIYWGNRPSISWQFYEAEAPNDCNKIIAQGTREDLTNKDPFDILWGVSCKGDGCEEDKSPGDIDMLKLKLQPNPLLYWTLWKDRSWSMLGQDGNVYGDCIVFPHGDVDCWYGPYHIRARRKFRCLTKFTADNLNKGTMPAKRAEIGGNEEAAAEEQQQQSMSPADLLKRLEDRFATRPSGLVAKAYSA